MNGDAIVKKVIAWISALAGKKNPSARESFHSAPTTPQVAHNERPPANLESAGTSTQRVNLPPPAKPTIAAEQGPIAWRGQSEPLRQLGWASMATHVYYTPPKIKSKPREDLLKDSSLERTEPQKSSSTRQRSGRRRPNRPTKSPGQLWTLAPCANASGLIPDAQIYHSLALPEEWIAQRLSGRWIRPEEYFWTSDDFFNVIKGMTPELLAAIRAATGGAFHSLPLAAQCEILGLPIERVDPLAIYSRNALQQDIITDCVEEFVLDLHRKDGWEGDRLEGASLMFFCNVAKKMAVKRGVRFNLHYDKPFPQDQVDAKRQGGLTKDELKELASMYEELNDESEVERILEIVKAREEDKTPVIALPKGSATHLTTDGLLRAWRSLDISAWVKLFELGALGYSTFGWPDLTLTKNGRLKFVEVKQGSDKFTMRQPYWWRNIGRPMQFNVSVAHVTPTLSETRRRLLATKPSPVKGHPIRAAKNRTAAPLNSPEPSKQRKNASCSPLHDIPSKGLIIDSPYIEDILAGLKTWEMRTRATKIRGRIALIKKGSGLVVGIASLVDSLPALSEAEMLASKVRHRITDDKLSAPETQKWRYPWVLEEATPLGHPVKYKHPKGAVIWVELDDNVSAAIQHQLSR